MMSTQMNCKLHSSIFHTFILTHSLTLSPFNLFLFSLSLLFFIFLFPLFTSYITKLRRKINNMITKMAFLNRKDKVNLSKLFFYFPKLYIGVCSREGNHSVTLLKKIIKVKKKLFSLKKTCYILRKHTILFFQIQNK